MRSLGRTMQVLGMIILPIGMLMELSGELEQNIIAGVNDMLIMMCFGIALFGLGRILEGYGSR